jgi:hypothetical protein
MIATRQQLIIITGWISVMSRAHECSFLSSVAHQSSFYCSGIKNTECMINPHTNTISASSIVLSDLK